MGADCPPPRVASARRGPSAGSSQGLERPRADPGGSSHTLIPRCARGAAAYWTLGGLGPSHVASTEWEERHERWARRINFGAFASAGNMRATKRAAAAGREARPADSLPSAQPRCVQAASQQRAAAGQGGQDGPEAVQLGRSNDADVAATKVLGF